MVACLWIFFRNELINSHIIEDFSSRAFFECGYSVFFSELEKSLIAFGYNIEPGIFTHISMFFI